MRRKKRKPVKLLHVPVVHAPEVYDANAKKRREIATAAALDIAKAITHCGPGADAYGIWVETDRAGLLPPRLTYCCQRTTGPNAGMGWVPKPPDDTETMEFHGHPGWPIPIKFLRDGQQPGALCYPYRWERSFKYLEEYRPQSAEALRAVQERKRVKAQAENARRLAKEADWKRRNETPSLFDLGSEA